MIRLNDRKVLITGSTGYIGSALATRLTGNGWHIKTYDTQHFGNSIADLPNAEHVVGDILDLDTLTESVMDCTDVVHLAGIVTDELVDMNADFGWKVNVLGTANVIMACSRNNIPRLLFASSSSIYGRAAESQLCYHVVREWHVYLFTRTQRRIAYGLTKRTHSY